MKRISKQVEHLSLYLKTSHVNHRSGQATLEYILLLVIIVGAFLIMQQGLRAVDLSAKIASPIEGDYAHAYQLGHPKAKDEGGTYVMHPRMGNASGGAIQGRIFIYLGQKK